MDLGQTPAVTLADRLCSAAAGPRAFPFWADGGSGHTDRGPYAPGRHVLAAFPSRFERLNVTTLEPRELIAWLRARLPTSDPSAGQAPLMVVLLSYDAGRNLERLPATARVDPPLPDVIVAYYPAFLVGDSERGPWRLEAIDNDSKNRLLKVLQTDPAIPKAEPSATIAPLASSMSRTQHRRAIEAILDQIAAGDLYQANVARRLETAMPPSFTPTLYRAMRRRNPAAFGALWQWDAGDHEPGWLASSSPECLFTYDARDRALHSYPIKGTRPRGAGPAEDEVSAADLASDLKERAEHVMIVDLVRNDLGRVATIGSVHVPHLFDVMTLPTVHHMVSDVAASLGAEHDLADALAALFPGGSVTGAPKIAAMAAIEHVEALCRGFYTGSLGMVFGDGSAIFNILIRTCVAIDGRLLYQTGGGIVADSTPAGEWLETESKARAIVETLAALSASSQGS
ncbi:MAG: para-aminobenzoate synthetase component 1 [Myxococcota bacterium]|jgi:para-aminobenzoate synthetase component 1